MKQYSTSVSTRLECWRRSVAPTLVLGLLALPALAQTQAVSGQVKAPTGEGLPGVNVILKGTSVGTVTNAEGKYALAVPASQAGATLTFSFIGYKPQDVVVGNQATINVTLGEDTKELAEVVVTALGIKKEARSIGYTTQEISGAQLVKAREPNPVNSLTGKIAGLTVAPSAELLGRPQLLLRGSSNILFVVDGVPINSDTWNISPDDIETYTVLKGPNAAALYGFRGQNGAIMITTKRGTGDKRRVAVEFNSSTQFQPSYLAIPEKQNEYGFGSNYQYAYANNLYDEGNPNRRANIWGPRFEGQNVPQYDSPLVNGVRQGTPWVAKGANNFRDFMRVGMLTANNVSVSSSGDSYDVRLSASNSYQRGMVPNTGLNITNFNLSTGVNFNKNLKFDGALNLSLQNSPNIPQSSSGPESPTYIFQVYGSDSWALADMRDYYKGPQGVPGVQQYYAEYGRGNNPYFVAYEWLYGHKKTDLYGYGRLSYKLGEHLNVALRSQVTTWNQLRTEKVPFSAITYKTPDLRQGDYREDRRNLLETNTDLLVTYNQQLSKNFTLSAVGGANVRLFNYNASWATTDFLIVPGVYNFSNSKNPVQAYEYGADMTVLSAYATTDLTFRNIASLGLTSRFDRLSTLPANNRTIFYPSVSLSTVLNDYLKLPEFISFAKLRGSYANVRGGNTQATIGSAYQAVTGSTVASSPIGYGSEVYTAYDGPNYVNQATYTITKPYNNQPAAGFTNSLPSPDLKSFTVTSYEYGLDAKFFGNRLGLDVTHFTSDNGPLIFQLPVASSSGYTSRTTNAVTTRKTGWEVALTGAVLANPTGLSWDVLANWSTFRETLKEVDGTEQNILLPGPNHVFHIGDRLDGYYSYNYLRAPDGQIINAGTGIPLTRPQGTNNLQFMGNTNPDWVWGVTNRFSYKNFNFSFQFDGRVGGVIRDQVYAYSLSSGNHPDLVSGDLGAARLAEWQSTNTGTKAPTPAYVGPGVVVSGGTVKFDANGNISNFNELQFAPNTKAVTVQSYTQGVYNGGIEEPYMVSKTYAKLREVIIGYSVPASLLQARFIKGANISLVGRNLLYFAQRKDFDLDQYAQGFNLADGSTLKNPSLQSATTRSMGVNINLTF